MWCENSRNVVRYGGGRSCYGGAVDEQGGWGKLNALVGLGEKRYPWCVWWTAETKYLLANPELELRAMEIDNRVWAWP